MITISQKIEEHVNHTPFLRQAMSQGIVNYAALARQLQPQIQEELIKDVTVGAVSIALQRYASQLKPYQVDNPGQFLGGMALQSELVEITVTNSDELMSSLADFMRTLKKDRSTFFVFTSGLHETTFIVSENIHNSLKIVLKEQIISNETHGLTAISLQRLHEHLEAIGVLAYPLQVIAWLGISVVEIVTTLNEEMIILKDHDVDCASSAIRSALRGQRS